MKNKTSLLALLIASLCFLPPPIHAQQDNSRAPLIEYYVRIDRLDPANGLIIANGMSYYLLPETGIWLDNVPFPHENLKADMRGLWAGINARDQDGRRVLTALHLLKNETREQNPAGGLR